MGMKAGPRPAAGQLWNTGPGPWGDLECGECFEYAESTNISAGRLSLPEGWHWYVVNTNAKPGWFLAPICPTCADEAMP